MLTVFIATFVIFALVIFGMSLGYLVKRKSIQGSCGGISALGLEKVCDCPEPCDARKKRLAREAQRQQRRILPSRPGVTLPAKSMFPAWCMRNVSRVLPRVKSASGCSRIW